MLACLLVLSVLLLCCSYIMPPKKSHTKTVREQKESRSRRIHQATAERRKARETRPAGSTDSDEPDQPGSSHKGQQLGGWSSAQMKAGWRMLKDPTNTLSRTKIAAEVDISKTTFLDRVRLLLKKEADGEVLVERDFILQSGGKWQPRALTQAEECVLIGHVTSFGKRGFPLRPADVRSMGKELLQTRRPGGGDADEMSYNWQVAFLDRHPEMVKKQPRQMSIARATALNRDYFNAWFDQYEDILQSHEIDDPKYIWNIDETGVNECPVTGTFIVGDKIRSPFLIPRERGENITIMSYCNAAGEKSPPMVIMKGNNVMERWAEHMPRGWHLRVSTSGYSKKHLFAEYGNIFINYLHSRQQLDQTNLVILDGHPTHTYNSLFLLTLKRNNIEVISLPPHTTHYLQPLDQVPYAAFKAHWRRELRVFNRQKCGVAMSKAQFFLVFPRAWRLGMAPANIRAGFAMPGIWPLDRNAIGEEVFQTGDELSEKTKNSV